MLYRILHAIHQWYAITVFWIVLAVFLMSFPMIFFFPPGPILLVFLGLGFLRLAVAVGKALRSALHLTARHAMARGVCPRCRHAHPASAPALAHGPGRAPAPAPGSEQNTWRCGACGAAFEASGAEGEVQQPQTQGDVDRSPRGLLDAI